MKTRFFPISSLALSLLALAGLLIFPAAALSGAKTGLALCASVIVPSIFPFTVVACLLLDLRFPHRLGRLAGPLMRKLFGVSGPGGAAFFLGLAGGYPLGAFTVSEMYSDGQLKKKEAERLLGFCNNCGPAFIITVAGISVFNSAPAGFFLYGVHILGAVLTGVLLRGRAPAECSAAPLPEPLDFSAAFSSGVKRAALSSLSICGFVVFFSVLMSILDTVGALPSLCGRLSVGLGLELHFTRSLLTGILELGTGSGSMLGLRLNPQNAALAAFIIGWGGLSVLSQATAVIKESGLSAAKLFLGKLLHGLFSALIAYFLFPVFFS